MHYHCRLFVSGFIQYILTENKNRIDISFSQSSTRNHALKCLKKENLKMLPQSENCSIKWSKEKWSSLSLYLPTDLGGVWQWYIWKTIFQVFLKQKTTIDLVHNCIFVKSTCQKFPCQNLNCYNVYHKFTLKYLAQISLFLLIFMTGFLYFPEKRWALNFASISFCDLMHLSNFKNDFPYFF